MVIRPVRMGDFFEIIGEEAPSVGKALDIVVTTRGGAPMVGFPIHAAHRYVDDLRAAGFNIEMPEGFE